MTATLPFHVRPGQPVDVPALHDIWLRSVRATHTFLKEEDIVFFSPLVRDYLESDVELWVLVGGEAEIAGFMCLNGNKLDALFLAPEFMGKGGGRMFVEQARKMCGELTVDVNEQNTPAVRFYESCGFIVEGRSELDRTGRPYPLLHMRLRR